MRIIEKMEDIIEKIEENKIEIKSVSEYITEVSKIKTSHNIFYRGHPNEEFELEPSIYRKKSSGEYLYIENEDKIYREMIAKSPNDFSGKNTIESLVLMQHYGIPTRLLDLTTNPLVALYFACSKNNNNNNLKNGEVLIFDIPNESVCYSDSDRVTILANLAKCDKEFDYSSNSRDKNSGKEYTIEDLNELFFGKLLHYIKEDKSYFQPIIDPKDVGSVLAIRPKLDNPRIIRQYGAFLIFGVKEEDMEKRTKFMAKVNRDWIKRGKKQYIIFEPGKKKEKNIERIIIDASSKNKILKELETLGISAATLFPEIDKVADEIKKKFKS